MTTMLPLMGMIPLLMSTTNHRPKHRKAMGRHRRRNREDQIAHGNGNCSQSQDVQEALLNRKNCINGFMSWWCALRIAATRTPESSCKIACATSWLIRVRARLLTQAGLVMVVREYQGQVAAAQWRVLSCCQQPKLAVGAQLHQRRPTDKSIGLIVKE